MAELDQMHRALLEWYAAHARDLPWRRTKDPYLIWLSEIILQQTRVEQGLPYYQRFVQRFPDVEALASAPDSEVMKLWEGLGYYRRAENMLRAAREIKEKYKGRFPSTFDELIKLPGIGPYTAAAVASFAFNEPVAVTDGNVMRVLSRLTGKAFPVDHAPGIKQWRAQAKNFLNRQAPALHNQAIMELGALVCTPQNPSCDKCPLAAWCTARRENRTGELPVRKGKKKPGIRSMHYLISVRNGQVALRQRRGQDIWRRLYEFPLWEGREKGSLRTGKKLKEIFRLKEMPLFLGHTVHLLTHRKLELYFWYTPEEIPDFPYIPLSQMHELSLPVPLRRAWERWEKQLTG